MSNTADILQSLYSQENYPQEVSIVEEVIDTETLLDIWIEIEPVKSVLKRNLCWVGCSVLPSTHNE